MPSTTTNPTTSTMLLQLGKNWAVCTRSAIPIILERFSSRAEAMEWQQYHEARLARTRAA
jgi:hypothetical protein